MSTVIERIEHVRKALGWSGRQLAREAGLRHEGHYAVIRQQFEQVGSAKAETIDALVLRLVREGWAESWLRHGVGPERAVAVTRDAPTVLLQAPRSFTPTPAPQSQLRAVGADGRTWARPMPQVQANRDRAKTLLVARGHDETEIDELLALIAFDERLAPCEDRPVSWWIDSLRVRMQG